MDPETIAILVGCIATVAGALAFVARSQAKAAEKNAAAQNTLVRDLAVTHAQNVETRLGELVSTTAMVVSAVRECTAAMNTNTAVLNQLVSRFDPPPGGGVLTETSEDETPPLGFAKPKREPTQVYQFKRRGLNDK